MELYWHFAQVDEDGVARLGYGDGREIKVGETLRVEGEPVLCQHGLHASKSLWDALGYALDNRLALCRVTLGGTIDHDSNKSVANERTVVAMLDADTTEKLLCDWARWCALQVVHLWDAPDIVRQYLETGDESLRVAAEAAARAAVGAYMDWSTSVAWAAARAATEAATAAAAAARDAARNAARNATAAAARDAARNATAAAAKAASWAAARVAAETETQMQYTAELELRVLTAMGMEE